MKYIALLRGINVGGNHKVEMKKLKILFESLSYTNVSTYINSGNIIFETTKNKNIIYSEINNIFKKEFKFEIPLLIKSSKEITAIAKEIPEAWKNNAEQKSDVAFLFPEVDSKKIIDELPLNKDYVDMCYIKGAVIWNITRENYNKSRLNKIISHESYKHMTIRNVNTARYLAQK